MNKELLQRTATRLSTSLWTLTGRQIPDCLAILVYHRVCPIGQCGTVPAWNVTPDSFRRQLSELQEAGYRFWPLRRVLEFRASGQSLPRRTAVLTFDDGYENNLVHALPVMRELNVPGTLFLNTAFVDSNEPYPFEPWGVEFADRMPADVWRPATLAQCQELLDSGLMDIGAHTHTHQDFRGRPAAFADDLTRNIEFLRTELGRVDVPFAFPYGRSRMGYTSPELVQAVKAAGLTCALSTDSITADPSGDPYSWGRFSPFEWDNGATLVAKFGGWYRWAPRLQEQLSLLTRRSSNFKVIERHANGSAGHPDPRNAPSAVREVKA